MQVRKAMKKPILIFIFSFLCVAFVNISCSFISDITNKISDAKGTAQSVATDVHQGQLLLGTAKAFATEFGDSEILSTVKALATEAKGSGLVETAQAYITFEGPAALETLKAFATEEGPELLQTSKAYVTEMGENNVTPPTDIPVVPADKNNFYVSQELVSYFTSMDFQSVLSFYKNELPNNGWTKVERGWVENPNSAILNYEKPDRSLSITLSVNPLDNHTVVMITIQPK